MFSFRNSFFCAAGFLSSCHSFTSPFVLSRDFFSFSFFLFFILPNWRAGMVTAGSIVIFSSPISSCPIRFLFVFTLSIQFTRKPVHLPRATVDPGIFPEISIMSNVLRRRACTAHCAVCLLLRWLLPLCRLLQKEKLRFCKSTCSVSSLFIPLFPIQFSSWQPEACLYFIKRLDALRTCPSKLRQASMQAFPFLFLFDQ